MTDKENDNSSNSKMADIKNRSLEQQEQDINLQIANLQICTSNSQKQMEIVSINEELERSPNRSRNTESNKAESSKKNEQESDSYLNCVELKEDPLLTTEKFLLKYNDFIEYVYQILKKDEEKQDWNQIVETIQKLVKTLNQHLRVVDFYMKCLKELGCFEKQYQFSETHILNILNVIRHINTRIASSINFRLVSDIKNRGKVLPICLGEFERWREDLSIMIDSTQLLKKLALKLDRDDETRR